MMRNFLLKFCVLISACIMAEASYVVEITSSNFKKIVSGNKHVFIKFFTPWCGHCKSLAPVWEDVASIYKDVPDIVIGEINCNVYEDLGMEFGIEGYPTLLFFSKGSTSSVEYENSRTKSNLVQFLNEKTGQALSPAGKERDPEQGRIPGAEVLVKNTPCSLEKPEICFQDIKSDLESIDFSYGDETKQKYLNYYNSICGKILQILEEKRSLQDAVKELNREKVRLDGLSSKPMADTALVYLLARSNILETFIQRLKEVLSAKDEL